MMRVLGSIAVFVCICAASIFGTKTVSGQTSVKADEKQLPVTAEMRTEVVEKLAKHLEGKYVFPDVAKKMAESLRTKLNNKEFDGLDTGKKLSRQLQNEMQAISKDKHLRVDWSAEPMPRPKSGPAPKAEKEKMASMARWRNAALVKLERLPGNVGYLELRGFMDSDSLSGPLSAAMSFLINTDALIIDLRKNGGGSPKGVQAVCSYLFAAEPPTHLNSLYWRRDDSTEEYWTLKDLPAPRFLYKPVYVLTSQYTFSGAEECAYNLQTRKRAIIVGETTGGGAHPGGGFPLGDHFIAFIPTGRAINPVTNTNWEGTGVKPEVTVDAEKALTKAHELALAAIRETCKDPDQLRRLEQDIDGEKRISQRFSDRKQARGD